MRHNESNIQKWCFKYFRLQYPEYRTLFIAVPNGCHVSDTQRKILIAEGMTSGVADTMLLVPSKGYHGLMMEFKTDVGRQSASQKEWQAAVEREGYLYVVIRSLEQFQAVVREYLCYRSEINEAREDLDRVINATKKSK